MSVGVITEQGDLGFGFDPLSQKDQQVYNESVKREQQEKSSREDNSRK